VTAPWKYDMVLHPGQREQRGNRNWLAIGFGDIDFTKAWLDDGGSAPPQADLARSAASR